eukprot:9486856-Pyramimonas_sp.AAC.3
MARVAPVDCCCIGSSALPCHPPHLRPMRCPSRSLPIYPLPPCTVSPPLRASVPAWPLATFIPIGR